VHNLSSRGLAVKPVGLQGRFHHSVLRDALERIAKLCESFASLRFPTADSLLVPLRSNIDGKVISSGFLHTIALKSLLTEVANWHLTVIIAGLVNSIPRSIVRKSNLKVVKLCHSELPSSDTPDSLFITSGTVTPQLTSSERRFPSHAVAIIGVACKFPGADSLEEFWDIVRLGTSMVEEVPPERFSTTSCGISMPLTIVFLRNLAVKQHLWTHNSDFYSKLHMRQWSRRVTLATLMIIPVTLDVI
jgi:hypothetical protein